MSEDLPVCMEILHHELKCVNACWMPGATRQSLALLGSANLYVRGIIDRVPGDVDVMVSKRVWGDLLARPRWHWETPDAGNPPMLVAPLAFGIKASLFMDWKDDYVAIDIPQCLAQAEPVEWEGNIWPCVSPMEVRRHKLAAITYPLNSKREIHLKDIRAIEDFVASVKL